MPLSLKVVDTRTLKASSATRFIAVGTFRTDAQLAVLAASHNVTYSATELTNPESYVLTVTSSPAPPAPAPHAPLGSAVFVVGGAAQGAFYGMLSLASLANVSTRVGAGGAGGAGTSPYDSIAQEVVLGQGVLLQRWRVVDRPDMVLRGYEVEQSYTISPDKWCSPALTDGAVLL